MFRRILPCLSLAALIPVVLWGMTELFALQRRRLRLPR